MFMHDIFYNLNALIIYVDVEGVLGAEAGTLTFMVGASERELFERVQPILSLMGKNIVHCGQVGHGQIAKICNNMLLGVSMLAVSETMNLVRISSSLLMRFYLTMVLFLL